MRSRSFYEGKLEYFGIKDKNDRHKLKSNRPLSRLFGLYNYFHSFFIVYLQPVIKGIKLREDKEKGRDPDTV